MTERQQKRSTRLYRQCRYFDGISNHECRAGLVYKDQFNLAHTLPCHRAGGGGCTSYEPFTPEEIEADNLRFEQMMDELARGIYRLKGG